MIYSCVSGHLIGAHDEHDEEVDLTNHMCPVCLGKIKDELQALTHPYTLSPMQDYSEVEHAEASDD